MMDRPSASSNPPFEEQGDDNGYVTQNHFIAQRVLHQEKFPKLKSATSTSYHDLDIDHTIPFYGTQEPEEYLEWERLMDDYLKQHQVPPEDQVKCATRNFHDYASAWWLHTPSETTT